MKNSLIFFLALMTVLGLQAQSVPNLINYQGRLTDPNGTPLPLGTYAIQSRLWDSQTANAATDLIWAQQQNVTVQGNGVFNVILGAPGGSAIPGLITAVNDLTFAFTAPNRFLGLTVVSNNGVGIPGATEILPRQQLLSVPFALQAQRAQVASTLDNNLSDALCPVGSVISFAGANAPNGWLVCDGRALSSAAYPTLFGTISNNWGAGLAGTTNDFNLPDLRGMFLRGWMPITNVIGSGVAGNSNATFLSHGFQRSGVQVRLATGTSLPGLKTNTDYFAIYVDQDHLAFATNHSNAIAGIKVGISNSYSATIQQWVDPDNANRDLARPGAAQGGLLGSFQFDQLASHDHTFSYAFLTSGNNVSAGSGDTVNANTVKTGSTGGNETRPKNVYVNYIIKY
jgi:microcystin-dependent protein